MSVVKTWKINYRFCFFFTLSLLLTGKINAQYLKVVPIESIAEIESEYIKNQHKVIVHPFAWSINDTMDLPFFEDFTQNVGYPDPSKWVDRQVWINNSFSTKHPNANVATFDHLNSKGNPYQTLNKNISVFADSLTSQPINLQFYKFGSNTFPYKPTDNVYLSFFYQTQGLGDLPEPEDSLILFFKGKNHVWHRVWAASGAKMNQFNEVFVPVDRFDFFNPDFQFRFVNYTKATGNLNHWHIDYIRMDRNRTAGINDIEDVGVVTAQAGLCTDYSNVPYSHYKSNVNSIRGKGAQLRIRNLNETATVQTRFQLEIKNGFGQRLFEQDFTVSSRNVLPKSDTAENFNTPVFDTLTGNTPKLNYSWVIDPRSNDNTPQNYNSLNQNNRYSLTHQFMPWYSYDDGSAEGGFGLDYAFLGNIRGQFAMEFNTLQDDSLRGLAIYFTQVKEDVSFRSFKLRIWKKLSPLGSPDNQDQLIYEFAVNRPVYRDSINHFNYIFFDSVLFLPKGQYYVGWIQQMPYVLNVGYDNNYRFMGNDVYNPHLFYNLLGSWERADYSIKGTPMIRMMFGERLNYSFSTEKIPAVSARIYPNPSQNIIKVDCGIFEVKKVKIMDASGRLVKSVENTPDIDISDLKPGSYYTRVQLSDGRWGSVSFQKINNH